MLSCEVALYPQDTADSDGVVQAALDRLKKAGVTCEVGPVSTFFAGDPEVIWNSLRTLYTAAAEQGKEVAMVATITNSVP